jgi:hypothetical protein
MKGFGKGAKGKGPYPLPKPLPQTLKGKDDPLGRPCINLYRSFMVGRASVPAILRFLNSANLEWQ